MFQDRHEMVRALVPQRGAVVEVGVQFGRFAEALLRDLNPRYLALVDSWKHFPAGPYTKDPANVSDEEQEERYQECVDRFAGDERVQIIRLTSRRAAPIFPSDTFHLVYLDADHTAQAMRDDLPRWYRKVRSGGIFAGHDYTENEWIAVKPAVDDFVRLMGLELMLSAEPSWPSWAVRKP